MNNFEGYLPAVRETPAAPVQAPVAAVEQRPAAPVEAPNYGPPAVRADQVESTLAIYAEHQPDEVAALRRELGGDLPGHMRYFAWLAGQLPPELRSETLDNVETFRVAAYLGRKFFWALNDRKGQTMNEQDKAIDSGADPAVTAMSEDAYEDALGGVRKELREAQSMRDSKKAERLYQREQALIRARHGSGRIVDGVRTL